MNCILYARQAVSGRRSLELQVEQLREYARRHGITEYDILTETAPAARFGERAEFNAMIKKISSEKADTIVCRDLSRLTRNPNELGIIFRLLQQGLLKQIITQDGTYYQAHVSGEWEQVLNPFVSNRATRSNLKPKHPEAQ
jgi:DNA invertase Pin-like site-specific DNA recombinase